jgi:putative DNA primase/helicase
MKDDVKGSAKSRIDEARIELDPDDPMQSARALVTEKYTTADGHQTLHRHRNTFLRWTGSYYRAMDDETIEADIWTFLEGATLINTKGKICRPTITCVANVREALQAVCQLDERIDPPTWLADRERPPARELFAAANGLVHLPTGVLYGATPEFFNVNASDVVFDPAAPEPTLWISFLNETIGDEAAITAQQDWFGYTLSSDTTQQKIVLKIGDKRSGKGTTGRIHRALVGHDSVAGPTMSSLGETFGLEPLINKKLAIISDARIGKRTDTSTIVERLLSISGEDGITVARKFKPAWNGTLEIRIEIMTNEMPALSEGSGALVGRLIVILFPNSFYGREDPNLTSKLLKELSGILNWAIEGYRRLRERGHFVQPSNAEDRIEAMERLGAPVKAFVADRCEVDPGKSVDRDVLFSAWKVWCEHQGRRDPGTKEWFSRNLMIAVPGVKATRPREGDIRTHAFEGIGLAEQGATKDTSNNKRIAISDSATE